MPCRRPAGERFLFLERGGAGTAGSGSKEVDALVAKLGEVLQLSSQHRTPAAPRLLPRHHGRDRVAPYSSPRSLGFFASLHHRHPPSHPRQSPSLLLWPPPPPPPPPTQSPSLLLWPPPPPPPPPPTADQKGSPRVSKQLCGRGWLRSSGRAGRKQPRRPRYRSLLPAEDEEDGDPHRLLQQLILSGNLIKEAVRRLQLAASTAAETSSSCTGSPGSVSSAGSCSQKGPPSRVA
uniref:GSK-3-binding protein n=1 Tax=Laticauda laticaudata TaxID=8630 RepID=A0A8C5RXX7_LATLA